jgi:hypothetical protein
MSTTPQADKPALTIRDLYPKLSDQEAIEAEENLARYIQLALQIYERIREDPEIYTKFRHLTASKSHPSMHDTKVDFPNNLLSTS